MSNSFKGEIVVTSRIVDYLSSGLYESPAACLKELVNNSYDADATRVEVFVKPDSDRIIVSDNGHGMDSKDFRSNFSKISESLKRSSSDLTETQRPKIGRIGIGFIAANEICEVMQVISTKRGSKEKIDVEINFKTMRLTAEERRKNEHEFSQADFVGTVTSTNAEDHYTHVFLKCVKGDAQNLFEAKTQMHTGETTLYGRSKESITTFLRQSDIRSWDELDFYSQTMLGVALNVPVRYADEWYPEAHRDVFEFFDSKMIDLDFQVIFDGTELRKPTVFPKRENTISRRISFTGAKVCFEGYLYAQHGVLKPQDLNGVLIRIRNSAVGNYNEGFLGFPSSTGTLFQKWISAEVWASDDLEDAMNIDRKTLRISHPAYLEMVGAFHAELSKFLTQVRSKLYSAPSARKRVQRARSELTAIEESLKKHDFGEAFKFRKVGRDLHPQAKLALKNYSTSELLSLVFEVAERSIPKKFRNDFVNTLLERILGK